MSPPVEFQKSNGNMYGAGALARALGEDRYYGCHYGMRSTLDADRQLFFKGWDDCNKSMAETIVVVYRVRGGDVYEQPVRGVKRYWMAVRAALQVRGLRLSDVVICK